MLDQNEREPEACANCERWQTLLAETEAELAETEDYLNNAWAQRDNLHSELSSRRRASPWDNGMFFFFGVGATGLTLAIANAIRSIV